MMATPLRKNATDGAVSFKQRIGRRNSPYFYFKIVFLGKLVAGHIMKNFVAIVFTSILIAIIYGIVHDQITIRISLEYFTIGHGRIIASDDPTELAFDWGIRATWWLGLIIGIVVGLFATVGKAPVVTLKDLMIPVAIVLVFTVSYAIISGILGFRLANSGELFLPSWLAERIPEEKHLA